MFLAVCNVTLTYWKSCAKNLFDVVRFYLGLLLQDEVMVDWRVFLSGGYNLHWFSDALGLVTFVYFIKQTFWSTSCSYKHLGPLPAGVYFRQP